MQIYSQNIRISVTVQGESKKSDAFHIQIGRELMTGLLWQFPRVQQDVVNYAKAFKAI